MTSMTLNQNNFLATSVAVRILCIWICAKSRDEPSLPCRSRWRQSLCYFTLNIRDVMFAHRVTAVDVWWCWLELALFKRVLTSAKSARSQCIAYSSFSLISCFKFSLSGFELYELNLCRLFVPLKFTFHHIFIKVPDRLESWKRTSTWFQSWHDVWIFHSSIWGPILAGLRLKKLPQTQNRKTWRVGYRWNGRSVYAFNLKKRSSSKLQWGPGAKPLAIEFESFFSNTIQESKNKIQFCFVTRCLPRV